MLWVAASFQHSNFFTMVYIILFNLFKHYNSYMYRKIFWQSILPRNEEKKKKKVLDKYKAKQM